MNLTYKGKPIIPTKKALGELSKIDINLFEVPEILERGFQLRKRRLYVDERAIVKGKKIINVVIIDMDNYYKLIHIGEFTLSKKFKKLIWRKNGL